MKKYHISYSLVSNCDAAERTSVGRLVNKDTLKALKETVSFVKKDPEHLGALVWFRGREKITPELLDYIEKNKKYIHGLKFHPWCAKLKINAKTVRPWIELARKLDYPILVHTATDCWSDIKYLKLVADEYKDVKFVAAHMQLMSDNKAALKVLKTTPNVYADTAWVDMKIAAKVMKTIGEDRIMFGTDNPIDGLDTLNNPMYEDYFTNKAKLSPRQMKKLMADNAISLYRL